MKSHGKKKPDEDVDTLRHKVEELERWFRIQDRQIRVLERERQKFSAVVNHTDAGFLVVDSSLQVVWANEVFTKRSSTVNHFGALHGVRCNRLLCLHKDICDMCPSAQALTSGVVAHHEIRLEIEGKPHHLYATAMPIKSPEGKIDEAIIMLQDITDLEVLRRSQEALRKAHDELELRVKERTAELLKANVNLKEQIIERKRAEKELRESEGRYRSLFDGVPIGLYRTTPKGQILEANPALVQMLGYPDKETYLKLNVVDDLYVDPEDRKLWQTLIDRDGVVLDFEARVRRRDQTVIWMRDSAKVVRDDEGRVLYYEGIWEDITQRKQAEEDLRQAEEKYRTIFENAVMGIFQTTISGQYLTANPTLARTYGYESPEELMAAVKDLNHQFYVQPGRREEFIRMVDEHEAVSGFESQVYCKDGSVIWISESARAVRDISGKLIGFEGTTADITERKRAEEEKTKLEAQLRQSQKMQAIGTLAGGIAHDFNNILWVIMGNTEMSLRKLPGDSPIRTKLQEILTASKRAQNLVKQILIFSRKEEQERKPIQIHLVVKEALKLLEATLPSTIKIRHNIDKDCGRVVADPTQIHQMVVNLCTNAYQAIGETGGLLEMSLDVLKVDSETIKSYPELQEGSYIEFTISDTGCGMDKATMERIFEPFFTTKEVGEGTGLGLATVHGFVTSLGGTIKVYSEPGKGSKFQVLLPRHDRSGSEEPMAQSNFRDLRGTERILVVDDEKQIVAIVQDMLEELGYDVTTKTSSVEALNQFSAQPDKFDLVITDQTMPEMTGIELAKQMLRIRPDIPVILATGFSKMITEENIRNSGIREYLKKPIVFHDLENVVRDVLDDKKIKRNEIFL